MIRNAPLWPVMAVTIALLAVFDPLLARLVPSGILAMTGLTRAPVQFLPLLLLGAGALFLLRRGLARTGGFTAQSLILLLAAAQLNGFAVGPLDLFDLAVFSIFGIWLATRALDTRRPIYLPPAILLGGLLIALSVAHLPVGSPVRWFIGTFGITRAALVAFLITDLCRDGAALTMFIRALLAVAAVSAAIGIVQFTLAYSGIYYFTFIDPPLSAFKPTPLGFVMRASGLCITAQHYSSFLVLAFPFALWRLSDNWRLRDFALVALLAGGILVSWNFGALFAAMLIGAALPFLRYPGHIVHILLGAALVASLGYFTGLLQLVYDISFGDAGVAKGIDQRHTLFQLGIEKIADNPLIGTGPQQFASGDGNFWHRPVHNAFGQAGAELGILATLILVAMFFYLATELGRLCMYKPARAMAAPALLALFAFLQLTQSEPNLDQANTWLMFGFAQAIALVLWRELRGQSH